MTAVSYRTRYEKMERAVRMATAYVQSAERWLFSARHPHASDTEMPLSPSWWTLLSQMIDTATEIVEHLPDEFFESSPVGDWFGLTTALGGDPHHLHNSSDEPLEKARKLIAMFESRREREKVLHRIRRLENVDGREPEEANTFLAKASELRRRLEK